MKNYILFLLLILSNYSIAQFSAQNIIIESETARPTSVFSVDLDGDGDIDILVASNNDSKISWYENEDGLGTFGSQKIISSEATGATHVHAADIDNDGDIDVLSASQNDDHKIAWYKNENGLGDFSDPIFISSDLDNAVTVYGTDVDNDGDIDVLSASEYDDKIAWYENEDGQGSFSSQKIISSSVNYAEYVYAADLDGDGDQDAISASGWDGEIKWYKYDETTGSYSWGNLIHDYQFDWPTFIYAGDVDGDGDLDVLMNSDIKDKISWFKNEDGLGNFSDEIIISEDIQFAKSVITVDLDGDNDMDLLFSGSEEVGWFENEDGQGNFGEKQTIENDLNFPRAIHFADYDNDGDMDIVVANLIGDDVFWYKNEDGLGSFGSKTIISKPGLAGAQDVFIADLNNDNKMDIVAVSTGSDKLVWYRNEGGQGSFSAEIFISDSLFNPESVITTDIDNDGDQDLLCAAYYDNNLTWYENLDGLGNFGEQQLISDSARSVNSIYAIDMDGDNDMDLLSTSNDNKDLSWYKNENGVGTFSAPIIISTDNPGISSISTFDIDGDADLDIIYTTGGQDKVSWIENLDGQFNFGLPILISQDYNNPSDSKVGDIDGDGDADIIVSTYFGAQLVWFENLDGLGNYGTGTVFSDSLYSGRTLALIDYDNDGDLDVVAAASESNSISLFENEDGLGSFSESIISNNVKSLSGLHIGDLDNDGAIDIVSSSTRDDKIAWYKNLLNNNKITGVCFFDENENGLYDMEEKSLKNQNVILTPDPLSTWTSNNTGQFNFIVDTGNYTLSYIAHPNWALTTGSPIDLTIDNTSPAVLVQNFGLTATMENFAIESNLTSAPTRCGFIVPFWLQASNTGNQIVDGNVMLELDPLVSVVSTSIPPSSINGNIYTWEFSELYPTYAEEIMLTLQMPGVDQLGETIQLLTTSNILDDTGNILFTNLDSFQSIINCAYDPNDKLVKPDTGEAENFTLFGDTLAYTIRFQNTGTDTAFNVILEDQLDPNLDWTTFTPISGSHSFEVFLDESGFISFKFFDILLPDSTTNQVGSHGYVKYSILHKSGLAENTVITNSASIFFDFNPPIYTNQTINTLVSVIPTSIVNIDAPQKYLKIIPNPFRDQTTMVFEGLDKKEAYNLSIINSTGQLVKIYSSHGEGKLEIDRGYLSPGIYFYLLTKKGEENLLESGKIIAQ